MKHLNHFITLVIVTRNDAPVIESLVREAVSLLRKYSHFELLVVDAGSTDSTRTIIEDLLSEIECVRFLRLPRGLDEENALIVGLENSLGDIVLTMQANPSYLRQIEQRISAISVRSGLYVGVRDKLTLSLYERWTHEIFYFLCERFLGLELIHYPSLFIATDRRTLVEVNRFNSRLRFAKCISNKSTFEAKTFPLDQQLNKAYEVRNFFTALNLGMDLIVFNSTRLLRVVTGIALALSTANLFYIFYIVAVALFKKGIAPGWATLSFQSAISYFLMSLVLGTLSEYLGRAFFEGRSESGFQISEQLESVNMVNQKTEGLNVVESSTQPTLAA